MAAVVTADEARRSADAFARGMNASRYVPEMPEIFKKISEENRLYIYNVGPWVHTREMGSAGVARIPACRYSEAGDPLEEFGKPYTVEGVEQEPYPVGPTEMVMIPKCGKPGVMTGGGEGILLAQQILGEGPMIPRSQSFRPFGVFISKTYRPSKEDLAEAKEALWKRLGEMIAEANSEYANNKWLDEDTVQKWYLVAARILKKSPAECPWMADRQAPAARENCPGCGSVYEKGILKCRHCGFVLDKPRYDDAVKKGLFAA
jgi:hypothetical protein